MQCDAPEVFLIGANGQGKTNFLEAVYLLCFGSSFRTRSSVEMISWGYDESIVGGILRTRGMPERRIGVRLAEHRQIHIDGKPVFDRKELLRNLPCIAFCHDDLQFVRGTPERRRWFFDQTLSLLDPLYVDTIRAYRRVLKSRNLLLRSSASPALLEPFDLQLSRYGWEIRQRREEMVFQFNQTFAPLFRRISGSAEELRISYRPSWDAKREGESVAPELMKTRDRDYERGVTTTGAHRDRYLFEIAGRPFRLFASTGQQRLCSLVLRIAQARFYADHTGNAPLLLLDDVLLELDDERKVLLMAELPSYDQAFFTFLPGEGFDRFRSEDSLVLEVRQGRILRGEY